MTWGLFLSKAITTPVLERPALRHTVGRCPGAVAAYCRNVPACVCGFVGRRERAVALPTRAYVLYQRQGHSQQATYKRQTSRCRIRRHWSMSPVATGTSQPQKRIRRMKQGTTPHVFFLLVICYPRPQRIQTTPVEHHTTPHHTTPHHTTRSH